MLVDIVSASANATPGLGRYPPFKREVDALLLLFQLLNTLRVFSFSGIFIGAFSRESYAGYSNCHNCFGRIQD